MKIKKILPVLALILALPLCLLSGCVGATKHEASSTWAHDTDFHWHTCVCEKSDCTQKYDLAAHTWIDGMTNETLTQTTTNQACTCGATNQKITQTEEQMYQMFLTIYAKYANTDLDKINSYTLTGESDVRTLNTETYEYLIVASNGNIRFVKKLDTVYVYYLITYTGEISTETLTEQKAKEHFGLVANDLAIFPPTLDAFKTQVGNDIEVTLTKTNGIYEFAATTENAATVFTFNETSLLTFTQSYNSTTYTQSFTDGFNETLFNQYVNNYITE